MPDRYLIITSGPIPHPIILLSCSASLLVTDTTPPSSRPVSKDKNLQSTPCLGFIKKLIWAANYCEIASFVWGCSFLRILSTDCLVLELMSVSPPTSLRYQVPVRVTNKLSHGQCDKITRARGWPLPFPWVSLLLILDIINDPVKNVSHNEDRVNSKFPMRQKLVMIFNSHNASPGHPSHLSWTSLCLIVTRTMSEVDDPWFVIILIHHLFA